MSLEANINGILPQVEPARPVTIEKADASLTEHRRESLFRLGVAGLILVLGFIGEFGVAWDIQWHTEIGRDNFWTAPHLVLYATVGASGLLALAMVLLETFRYYRGSRTVTAKTTTPFFGIFHSPLGFYMTGFGILVTVLAAPFDDYWHQIYGIDVTIWAAFHIMGIIGGAFGTIGSAYCFASEYNRSQKRASDLISENASPKGERLFTLLALLFLALSVSRLISQLLLMAVQSIPGNRWNITDWKPLMYPSLVALAIPGLLVAIVVATGRPGMATLSALMLTAMRWVLAVTIPSVTESLVASEGLARRPSFGLPSIVYVSETYPLWIVGAGLVVDLGFVFTVWLWSRRNPGHSFRAAVFNFGLFHSKVNEADKSLLRWTLSLWPALVFGTLAGLVVALTSQPYMDFYNSIKKIAATLGLLAPADARREIANYVNNPPDLAAALPLVVGAAILSAILGRYLGLFMRYNQK